MAIKNLLNDKDLNPSKVMSVGQSQNRTAEEANAGYKVTLPTQPEDPGYNPPTPPTVEVPTFGGSVGGGSAASDLANHLANRIQPWTGGQYGQALQQAMDKITNREKFSYDLNGDALYQQYKDKYINQGRMAMMDTLGQTTALTGGYGNSYAATAGNQAYQGYLQNLNDVVPQLYQMAYDKYNQEGQDLNNIYSMYNQQYNQDYGIYRDQVADWNAETNRLTDAYNQAQSLALQRAKMAQDAAQFNAEMQYKYDAMNNNSKLESTSAKYQSQIDNLTNQNKELTTKNGELENQIKAKANQSDKTDMFEASIMTPNEFAQRGRTEGGKKYSTYNEYLNDKMRYWYENGGGEGQYKLSEAEVAYLKGKYGI